jgi:hypothetical protein
MLTMGEVQERLGPMQGDLVKSYQAAVDGYSAALKREPEMAAAFGLTERAMNIHDRVTYLVRKACLSHEGVQVTKLSMFSLAVGNDLLVRFKFLQYGSPRNHDSEAQNYYKRQEFKDDDMIVLGQSGIFDPPTIVSCGYSLSHNDSVLARVLIRRDCKGHQPWYYTIFGDEEVSEPLLIAGTEEAKPARISAIRKTKKTGSSDSL